MKVRKIEITLSEKDARRLASKAHEVGQSEAELAAAAIGAFLEEDDYLTAVRQGIAQADAGELISNEEMGAWVESLRTANPRSTPQPKRR